MITRKAKVFEECLAKGCFYEAHEVLEELWFPRRFEKENEVQFLKGCINASVSFELYKRGRKARAKQVWATYLKYRQLLFQLNTPHLNTYYQLLRTIDNTYLCIHNKEVRL
jgi:hypothetical protein